MKSPLSFGLIVAVAGALAACSDSGDGVRPGGNGGTGNSTGSNGGTSSGGTAGTASGGTAGTASGGTAGTGSTGPATGTYGAALTINADGTVKDESGNTGINGAALVVASPMNPQAVAAFADGKLCMHGATAAGFTDYTAYWGAQINLDLNRVANDAAGDAGAAPGDAGADAGDAGGGEVLGQVAQAWDPRPVNVIGFSFKIDGPMVAPVLSVSAAPTGRDPSADPFCYRGATPVAGTVNNIDVYFTDLRLACWNSPPVTSSIFQITEPATYTTINNLGWQINAGPDLAYMFDFCVSDIKPILSN